MRNFWIRHDKACRRIAEAMGRNQGSACIVNHWMPDGAKDHPIDRYNPRLRLLAALDEIFSEPIDANFCKDAVECKLFGIGSEDYVVGSHEFYLGYVMTRPQMPCLDGAFPSNRNIRQDFASLLLQGQTVRSRAAACVGTTTWSFSTTTSATCSEIVRDGFLSKTRIAWISLRQHQPHRRLGGFRAHRKVCCALPDRPTAPRMGERRWRFKLAYSEGEDVSGRRVGICSRQQSPAGCRINAATDYDRTVIRTRQ